MKLWVLTDHGFPCFKVQRIHRNDHHLPRQRGDRGGGVE